MSKFAEYIGSQFGNPHGFVGRICCVIMNAEILGTYGEDFYQGKAALTCKNYGNGKAYYQAARCNINEMDFLFETLLKDAGIKYRKLPHGLEYHRRQSDKNVFDFYLNTSEDDIRIDVPHCEDVISGDDISGEISIPPKGFVCLKSTILRCF